MDGGMVFDGSNLPALLQNDRLPSSEILDSFWISNPCSSFHGSTSMVSFEASQGENNMIAPFFTQLDKDENVDEDFDKCFHQPEKKRRLTVDQVEFLERSFEVENKLEPDRKVQLAKELNLQPRQVAIWFQNRRARYKTKQLEKDYDFLKASYDKLKVDCGSLEKENDKLKHEVDLLMEKLLHREQGKAESEECEPSDSTESLKPVSQIVVCKQEDANSNSGKSDVLDDVLDSESPHNTDGIHSSLLDPSADSSDFSQDINGGGLHLLRPPRFPKLEEGSYIDVTSINACSLGYPVVEDQSFWFWPN